MQIFLRFAYGKVITFDIYKKITTLRLLIKEICNVLHIPLTKDGNSTLQFELTFINKANQRVVLSDLDTLIVKYGIQNNQLVQFEEKIEKEISIHILYQLLTPPKKQDGKFVDDVYKVEWIDQEYKTKTNTKLLDLRKYIEDQFKIKFTE